MASSKKLRFSGQNAVLILANTTTGDRLIRDIPIENFSYDFPFELNKKQYLGEKGPDYLEFADGWEAKGKFSQNDAAAYVAAVNALKAKAEGDSTDEFSLSCKFTSGDGGVFRIIFKDAHFAKNLGGDMGGRTELLTTELDAKGKDYSIKEA